jgi:hypothetical protein
MNMAEKHPCCQKVVQDHDDVDLNDLWHFDAPPLSSHVAMLLSGSPIDAPARSFLLFERMGHLPHDPPSPFVEILRIRFSSRFQPAQASPGAVDEDVDGDSRFTNCRHGSNSLFNIGDICLKDLDLHTIAFANLLRQFV